MASKTDYALGFTSLMHEVSDELLEIEGALPPWLTGSLLRTGPARFEIGKRSYTHWFDGLAMLHAFAFADGAVRYSNRFLHSKNWQAAEETGEIARPEFMTDPCRSLFGRMMAVFQPEHPDNANVNITVLGQQVVALTETPLPIRFDPHTLETLGPLALGNVVKGHLSTAHPQNDGERTYSFVIQLGPKSTYCFFTDENGQQRILAELTVDKPSYLHSFGMSESYLVLAEFPLRVNPLRLATSGKPFITNYRWEPERGTKFTILRKADGAVVARAESPACFCFHHVNAFEADGFLHVDLLAYPDAGIIDRLKLEPLRQGDPGRAAATLTRFALPLAPSRAPAKVEGTPLCETSLELPRFDYLRRAGKPYSAVWGVSQSEAAGWLDTIVKLDLTAHPADVRRWQAGSCYPGEPVFVARPGGTAEDDGVLLSVVLDVKQGRSFLLVLDAATLQEQARALAPHAIPFGFHGNHFPHLDRPDEREGTAAR